MENMKLKCILIGITVVSAGAVSAQSWLPQEPDTSKPYRLLECVYDEARLAQCREVTTNTDWTVSTEKKEWGSGRVIRLRLRLGVIWRMRAWQWLSIGMAGRAIIM